MHLDGKRIQRWSDTIGQVVVKERGREIVAYEGGCRPASPPTRETVSLVDIAFEVEQRASRGWLVGSTNAGNTLAM
jgi:hypothetical protein